MYAMRNTKESREQARAAGLQGYEVTEYADVKSVAGIQVMPSGRAIYKIFDGTAGNPSKYYSTANAITAQEAIDRHVAERRRSIAAKAERKAQNSGLSSHANTAQKIRERLKAEFPGVKFSVKSDSYSMGNSVRIYWTDGPISALVDTVAKGYQHGSFDGMTDSYNFASIDRERLGCSGVYYVFTERTQSDERKNELRQMFENRVGLGSCYSGRILEDDGINVNPWRYENLTPETWSEEYRQRYENEQKRQEAEREAERIEQERKDDEERRRQVTIAEQAVKIREDYQPEEGAPTVEITDAEGFSEVVEMLKGVYSVKAADMVYKLIDTPDWLDGRGGYDKTWFIIRYADEETGEPREYSDRYDVGDGDGGLIEHVRGCNPVAAEWLETFVTERENLGNVLDFARHVARKNQRQADAERAETDAARETVMLSVGMMDNEQLAELIKNCAENTEHSLELRRDMCRRLINVLMERNRSAAMAIYKEVNYLFS